MNVAAPTDIDEIYSLAHSTQINRQGNDAGTGTYQRTEGQL